MPDDPLTRVESQLEKLERRLGQLEHPTDEKSRGIVDMLSALAPFISGVLIASVGMVATILYNERQLQLTQLAALDKYRAYLASENAQERVFGYEAFVALGQEEFVAKLIGARRDLAGKEVLSVLAERAQNQHVRESARKSLEGLGALSAKYEGWEEPGAVRQRGAGGWAYGKYQLYGDDGGVGRFLTFLDEQYPELAARLNAAGGQQGAKSGTRAFREAWRELAADPEFEAAQDRLILDTYFDPTADRLKQELGLDVRSRGKTVQMVVWSVAIQHGWRRAISFFRHALGESTPDTLDDATLINGVYDARTDFVKRSEHFPPAMRRALVERYMRERKDALMLLAEEN